MQAGELNKRIILQYTTKVPDGMGSFTETETWTDAATVWAAIWPLSVNERIMSKQLSGELTHRIRIRYRRGIRTSHRIKFGERYFNIDGPPINPNERNEYLDIMAKEVA